MSTLHLPPQNVELVSERTGNTPSMEQAQKASTRIMGLIFKHLTDYLPEDISMKAYEHLYRNIERDVKSVVEGIIKSRRFRDRAAKQAKETS